MKGQPRKENGLSINQNKLDFDSNHNGSESFHKSFHDPFA